MNAEPTVTVSRRWHPPKERPDGTWIAELVDPEAADVFERRAYGPDADACARETQRHDKAWVAAALRAGDRDTADERLRTVLAHRQPNTAKGGDE